MMIYSGETAKQNKNIICGIYKITNCINNKIYVGQSIDIFTRWRSHLSDRAKKNLIVDQAINKYGYENFTLEILEETSPEELNFKECYWIEKLQSYAPQNYNVAIGGGAMVENSRRKKVSNYDRKTGEKIFTYCSTREAERQTGVDHSQISACCKGKREYVTAGGYFWAYGEENQIDIKKILQYKTWSPIMGKSLPVYQYSIETKKLIQSFENAHDAAKKLNYNFESICKACNGELLTYKNYIWSRHLWNDVPKNYLELNLKFSEGYNEQ